MVGGGGSTTDQLNSYGRKYIENFIGVFPRFPPPYRHYCYPMKFIVHSLPDEYTNGGHWIAVRVDKNKRAVVFDSRGKYPDLPLIKWLIDKTKSWSYNPYRYQMPFTLTVGHFCLFFLLYGTSDLKVNKNNEYVVKNSIQLESS